MTGRAHKIRAPYRPAGPIAPPPGSILLRNIGELVTLQGPPRARRGAEMRELGILRDAAVLVLDGRIAQVGSSRDLAGTPAAITLDCPGKVVTPGLVDAHTHALFAGSREDEVAMKAEGLSYQEIAARGGGIRSTLRRTREAADAEILRETRARLAGMMRHGTTTAEVKSGYGLGVAEEVRLLNLMDQLPAPGIPAVVPTFLGAHAVPPEFEGRAEAYAELVSTEMLRGVAGRTSARFCDVWVEEGAFTADQGRRLLKEAQRLGLEGKVHADELTACGGAELAADVGAVSADHCVHATTSGLREMAARGVIAVLLPGTSFSSRLPYADARRLLREDVPVALGTDLSPNSWIESMQTVLWLAAHHSGLTAAEGLTAATVNAAYAVGQGFETGTVEAGKRADLLVLDVPDHRQLGYRHGNLVEVVIAGGRVAAARPPTAPAAR